MFGALKDCTMHINVYVCICENESIGYLISTIHKIVITPCITYEIKTYSTRLKEHSGIFFNC